MRSRGAEARREIAPTPTPTGPRRALPARWHRWRLALLAGLGSLALVGAVGLAAGPVLGLTGTAPDRPAVSAPSPTPTPTPSTPVPSANASATPSDCRDVRDTRRTLAARKTPFTVCGVDLISKDHRVTAAYIPDLVKVAVRAYGAPTVRMQPEAAKALVTMFADARKAGYTLVVRSSYRSFATQKQWYATMSHALTAPPGASEHQSGLAVDLAGIERGRLVHGTLLATSRTGTWLVSHAADHGFILRYPTSQSKITGIAYEPWHFRYVGVTVAHRVEATKTKTLERYLQQS